MYGHRRVRRSASLEELVPAEPRHRSLFRFTTGPKCCARCLAALRQYAPENSEIIVVDDCSKDSSVNVVLQSGFRLVRATHQGGPAAARNLGAQVAEGDILIFPGCRCLRA